MSTCSYIASEDYGAERFRIFMWGCVVKEDEGRLVKNCIPFLYLN